MFSPSDHPWIQPAQSRVLSTPLFDSMTPWSAFYPRGHLLVILKVTQRSNQSHLKVVSWVILVSNLGYLNVKVKVISI